MRCPGPPCNKGPHCWHDPVGKKHYPLNTQYLKSLIMYVQDGHTLQTHDDVPKEIREQLYAEEQQSRDELQSVVWADLNTKYSSSVHSSNLTKQSCACT